MTLVKRLVKGSALTYAEADGNLDHFTTAIALKADQEAELISGGETTVVGTTITVAAAQWRVPPSIYAKVSDTVFTGITYSASGQQRYVAFYGTISNTVIKVEGDEDATAVLPSQPANTALISYALVGDASIGGVAQDLSGYQLKSDKSISVNTDQTSDVKYPTVKAVYDWVAGLFVQKNSSITGATKTKITYDSKGLVTAGADATQDDIGDGLTYKQYSATDKTKVSNVPSDTNASLALKAPLASPTFTGTVSGITKSMVSLGNVDNTSDNNKPVSTAQQTALDLKANIESTSTTGTAIVFTEDKVYGTVASPETGNITASTSGAKVGATALIIHNSGTQPTLDSKFAKLSGSGDYVTSSRNYIYCQYINSTKIIYSINQEA